MSDKDMPSRTALDLAVKPAGYSSWEEFDRWYPQANDTLLRAIALAYAADLDKADKVGREVLELVDTAWSTASADKFLQAMEILRANLLPDPIDPDLLEVFIAESGLKFSEHERMLVAGAFGWLAKRELAAKEQDRG